MMISIDADNLRDNIELLEALRASGEMTEPELRSLFFHQTLGYWYLDAICDGMDTMVGHALYRLTDFLDQSERISIILVEGVTVEDWRCDWEQMHPEGIPLLSHEIQESTRKAIQGA